MNQFYRALHMPPKRLLRKVMGEKEVYTIAVRPRPTAEGTEPLPALGAGPYTMLPGREGWWFADPLLCHRGGRAIQRLVLTDLFRHPTVAALAGHLAALAGGAEGATAGDDASRTPTGTDRGEMRRRARAGHRGVE